MAKYLDETGLVALWTKIKQRISDGVGDIDLSPYLKTENLATINGEKLSEGGNITIDLTLFKVVESLPTTGIDENKIYLVKSTETTSGNEYSEYVYANKKWELLGTYKSDVDLTPYAKTADVNTALATKVDKETGKGLSTNDFTDALKTKLEGVEAGANKYTHPTSAAGAKASGLYKIATDATGHVTAAAAVEKADITALGIPAQDTTYSEATSAAAGLMSASDKAKADAYPDTPLFVKGEGENSVVLASTSAGSATGTSAVCFSGSFTEHGSTLGGIASGDYSFAQGYGAKAIGESSHASGYGTKASGNYSHAEGNYTAAIGENSHAEGYYTTAQGIASHAEGNETKANGENSHAEGFYTTAQGIASHAEGRYNVVSSNSIHSVGVGESTAKRLSAEEIYHKVADAKNGYKYLIGIGGFDGTNFEVNDALNPDIKSVQEVINETVTKLEGVANDATADSAIEVSVIEALS